MEFFQFLFDFVFHIDEHLAVLVGEYGMLIYGILFLIIFCETGLVVTPFLPGDSLLFVAGTLASLGTNNVNVHLLVLLLIVAAISGDAVNYFIGRFFGKQLFKNPDSKVFKQVYLDKTHAFYAKHGGKTIFLARFVPIIRTFAPFVAGMGKMSYSYFGMYNIIGGIVWVALFTYAGFFFGGLEYVQKNLEYLIIGIIFVSILPMVIEFARSRMKSKTA